MADKADYFQIPFGQFYDVSSNTSNVTLNTSNIFEVQNTARTDIKIFFQDTQPTDKSEMITLKPDEFISFQLEGSDKIWAYGLEGAYGAIVLYKSF